jgi:uncharacterized protein
MITRHISENILKRVSLFPVIEILGARQVGKTTLAKSITPHLEKESVYLDLELESDFNKLENAELYLGQFKEKCIILDEVQRKPELFPVLRGIIDQHRVPGRFILLGSANPHLLKLSSESLAGRIVYMELTGFNVLELQNSVKQLTQWHRGSFPEPCLSTDPDFRKIWYESYIRSYVERDIPQLGLDISPQTILRCLRMIAHSTGQIVNVSTFARSLNLQNKLVSKIFDYFESTFIVRTLQPYFLNLKKRLVKSSKIFIRDSGLLHYLLAIDSVDTIMGHPILGHSWETFAIDQIISILGSRYQYYFYRTQDQAEVDLVICESDKPLVSIECKFTSTPKKYKGMTTAFNDLQTNQNYIIVPECNIPYLLDKNITVCTLTQFVELFQSEQL